MTRGDRVDVLAAVCAQLDEGDITTATATLRSGYPFTPFMPTRRTYSPLRCVRVFLRDGFVDRYSGARLIFPPVLRALTQAMPEDFPADANWTYAHTHPAYWELSPTLDHILPVARGGADDDDNLVTTSMLRNAAKANWTLAELGWSLRPPGDRATWDGLLGWFMRYVEARPTLLQGSRYLRDWHRATTVALPT